MLKRGGRCLPTTWSPDIMRHTYASMHYGLHGDKNGIANQLGHVTQGVLDHYINNGKKDEGKIQEVLFLHSSLSQLEEVV